MKRSDGIRSLFSADTAPWLSGCEVKPTYSWYLVVGSPSKHHWSKWPRLLLRAARPNIARLQNAKRRHYPQRILPVVPFVYGYGPKPYDED